MRKASEVFDEIQRWAEADDQIRGLVLSSGRVDGDDKVDLLSDYDVIVFVRDQAPYKRDDRWLEAFGSVMTRSPPVPTLFDDGRVGRMVIYDDGVRIDWSVADAVSMHDLNGEPEPYRVLLDKD